MPADDGVPVTPDDLGAPAADVVAVAAACRARALEREGIPMFLALQDLRPGRVLRVVDAWARAEGARLAALLDHYAVALTPDPLLEEAGTEGAAPYTWGASQWVHALDHDVDEAELIEALVVLSDQHLRARLR